MVFVQKSYFFLFIFLWIKQVGKDHFLILWIEKKMIFRPENWTVKKFQERHFSKGLVHGFCPKIEFLFILVFGMIKSENIFFHILDRKERVLDPKINVLKSAKNRHYRKGIIHCFCSKIELLFIWFLWYN